MRGTAAALAVMLALTLAGCATTPPAHHPQAALYDPAADAEAAVDAALARARARTVPLLLVLGANWCHDSKAFAGWSQQPENAAWLAQRFEIVFVDVGIPQTGKGVNMAIPTRFGLPAPVGTPMVAVIGPDGRALNADSAQSWRNAASRSDAAIRAELGRYAMPDAEAR